MRRNITSICLHFQMADSTEVSQVDQGSTVPPADSSDPGLNISTPSLNTELPAGALGVQRAQDQSLNPATEILNGPEGEKEEGEGEASSKERPPELHPHKGRDTSLIQKLKP